MKHPDLFYPHNGGFMPGMYGAFSSETKMFYCKSYYRDERDPELHKISYRFHDPNLAIKASAFFPRLMVCTNE